MKFNTEPFIYKKKIQTADEYFNNMINDGCNDCYYYDICCASVVKQFDGIDGFCTKLDDKELAMDIEEFKELY